MQQNSDFVCTECGKTFKNRGGLNLHMYKTHKMQPPNKHKQQQQQDNSQHVNSCNHEKRRLLDANIPIERKILRATDYKEVCTLCQEVL